MPTKGFLVLSGARLDQVSADHTIHHFPLVLDICSHNVFIKPYYGGEILSGKILSGKSAHQKYYAFSPAIGGWRVVFCQKTYGASQCMMPSTLAK